MAELSALKIDKTNFSISSISTPSEDKEYWFAQSPYERLRAVETLRTLNYGVRQSTARLQRVLEITQRS
jgi:hypothetical protein